MGIVRTHSIVGSFLIYLGAGLGFVTSALLLPHYLDAEQIGLINLLITYGALFAQLASAGFTNTITKMFPYFRNDEQQHNGFLFLTIAVVAVASVITMGAFFILYPYIVNNSSEGVNLMNEYALLIIPMFLFTALFNIFDYYTKALYNATRGILLKEVVLRIFALLLIVFYIFKVIDYNQFVYWYVATYGIILLLMIVPLFFEKQLSLKPNFSLIDRLMAKELLRVSIFGIIISSTNIIVVNIDRIMIEKLAIDNPLAQVGIYSTCSYFATMVILAGRPLQKISSTLIAEAWKRKDMLQLQTLYTKSSITQLIIGALVFFGLCVNLDYIFQIIPEKYESGKWVIIFLGLMSLSDMAAGVNKDIVSNSPNYEKLSHWTVGLIIGIVILNIIFIPTYGITGAAISSCIARIIYNYVAFHYVYKKFNLQPYSFAHIKILLIGTIASGLCYIIPETDFLIANILIKSGVLTLLFCIGIYASHVSEDVDELTDGALKKIGFKK